MATITFQNLFRIYKKLAGMTGTAETEAQEFHATYKLDVRRHPDQQGHDPRGRGRRRLQDRAREVHGGDQGDPRGARARAARCWSAPPAWRRAPPSAASSRRRSVAAQRAERQAPRERGVRRRPGRAQEAPSPSSTNMAGRGTDIMLGGNPEMLARAGVQGERAATSIWTPEEFTQLVEEVRRASASDEHDEVVELGGLHIVGTERHESRRIDNQLRGRAGRQGDPGSSRFYLSLEDDLMRIFAGDRVKNLMDRMGMPDDEPIEHPWVTKSVENAQRKVEERNFDIRKNLLEYDDVMNAQRKTVYALRQQLLLGPLRARGAGRAGQAHRRHARDRRSTRRSSATDRRRSSASCSGMFADPPLAPAGQGRQGARAHARGASRRPASWSSSRALQREVYQLWGVKLDVEDRTSKRTPVELYDELAGAGRARPHASSASACSISSTAWSRAMVEESCPANKPPEDWDWKGIREGFREHFKRQLGKDVEELGDAGARSCASSMSAPRRCYFEKEKELGVDNRAARLPPHLPRGHRRGVGRPPDEHGAPARRHRPARLRPARPEERVQEGRVQPLPQHDGEGQRRGAAALLRGADPEARGHRGHRGGGGCRAPGSSAPPSRATPSRRRSPLATCWNRCADKRARYRRRAPERASAPKIGRNDPCPCGSGKKFKKCHGAALEDEGEGSEDDEQPRA